MKPFQFESSTWLAAPVGDVFEFHGNPENLRKISPPALKILSITCEPVPRAGETFSLHVVQFGIPLRWTGVWETVERPRLLVDGALRSPFAFWRHHHIFEAEGDGCRMTDRVECALPGGVVGRLVAAVVLPVVFGAMFRARHAATRGWFAKQDRGTSAPGGPTGE